jgi:O-antigen/teichoic acid export membrane protein
MNTIQRIAKNIGVLSGSQVIGYLLAFIYTIYIARYLGADGYGILSFAIAFTTILGIFADLGLSTLAVRELSRDKSQINKYVGNITLLKIVLSVFTFGIIAIIINLLNYPQQVINVVYLFGLTVIVSSFSQMFYSLFQAHERMEYQSMGNILTNILIFAGIFYGISQGFDVIEFALIYFIASLIVLVYSFIMSVWRFVPPVLKFDQDFSKFLMKQAIPLSIVIIFSTMYVKIDTVLLSLLQGDVAVGWYNAAYRLIELLQFVPSVYTLAIFPVLSNFHSSSKKDFEAIYRKSFKYLIILGLPIAAITTVLADEIILVLFQSGFTESILALQILIWSVPFMFLSYTAAWIFISMNKQNLLLKLTFVGLILNVILNLILIPQFSYIGAAVVTVITDVFGITLGYYFLSKYICKIKIHRIIVKPAVASVLVSLLIFKLNMGLVLSIIISIISYLALLVLFKAFSKEDYEIFQNMLK